MSPFKPRGDRSLRIIVADLVARAQINDLITYEEFARVLDTPDRTQIRQAISAARPVILRDYNRALIPERGRGYRIARPGEFAGIAQDHRRKSDRQISKALAMIDNAPVDKMSPDELARHRAVGIAIHNLASRMINAEQRLADLETAVYGDRNRKVIQGKLEE